MKNVSDLLYEAIYKSTIINEAIIAAPAVAGKLAMATKWGGRLANTALYGSLLLPGKKEPPPSKWDKYGKSAVGGALGTAGALGIGYGARHLAKRIKDRNLQKRSVDNLQNNNNPKELENDNPNN